MKLLDIKVLRQTCFCQFLQLNNLELAHLVSCGLPWPGEVTLE